MARLIDADALKTLRFRMHSEFLGTVTVVAVKDIDEAPTIDAEPVKHGEWIYDENYEEWAERYVCSVCNHNAPTCGDYRHELTNYCPHCGADMRERRIE